MYFIDVQGTLISDSDRTPIRGAIEFIDWLNEKRVPYSIVTNNTKKESLEFCDYLKSLGFKLDFDKYLDPLMVLESRVPKEAIAAYGNEEFLSILVKMGYVLDYANPKTLLIGVKEDYSSLEYARMIDFLLAGAKLVGMHESSIYAKNSKRYPGVGAILKLLEFATSTSYEVVGKPSESFFEEALNVLKKQNPNASFGDVTIISDDVKGDLGGAKTLGMKTIFVTSGKYKNAQEIVPYLEERLRPDGIYQDMREILENL